MLLVCVLIYSTMLYITNNVHFSTASSCCLTKNNLQLGLCCVWTQVWCIMLISGFGREISNTVL